MAVLNGSRALQLFTCPALLVTTACTLTTDLDNLVGAGTEDAASDSGLFGSDNPAATVPESTVSPTVAPTGSTPGQVVSPSTDITSSLGQSTDDSTDDLTPDGGASPAPDDTQQDASMSPQTGEQADASYGATTDNQGTATSGQDVTSTSEQSNDQTADDSTDTASMGEATSGSNDTSTEPDEQTGVDPIPDAGSQCSSTLLFADDFEDSDLESWTATRLGTTQCQETRVSSANAFSGSNALRSRISCALEGDAGASGHDHYGSLQFSGDDVVNVLSTGGEGIDSPNGVVISFYVWIDAVETLGNGRWLSLLLLSGACDWSDSVFSLAIEDSSGRLAIGPVEPSSEYAPGAPAVASENWTRVTAYVNYYEQVFHVWQDGQPVVSVDFERPGQTLCHIMMGTMASENNDDLLVIHDQARVWRVEEPLADLSVEPCAP